MAEKKGGWKFVLQEADDFEGEADDFETNDLEDYEEETDGVNPLVTTAVFLGLVVLAVIICWFLWTLTHKEDDTGEAANQEVLQQETEIGGNVPGEADDMIAGPGENGSTVDAEADGNATDAETVGLEGAMGSEEDILTGEETQSPEEELFVTENETEEPVAGDTPMEFSDIAEDVTAKDVVNLRSEPSTLDSENIVAQLNNGEVIERIGINDITGWSKLLYNGQVVYAVSSYLTTDLTYETPVAVANPNRITTKDGRIIIFVDVDNYVTPKEYVNLRLEPSTSQGNATIHCQINNGTVVHRTGYSEDSGWSRVEYDGVVLYVVSSMVSGVEVPQ